MTVRLEACALRSAGWVRLACEAAGLDEPDTGQS
jgi:hypothetical protein